jgi:hypothetical protein
MPNPETKNLPLTSSAIPDTNRVVVTRHTTGTLRLRYSPMEPKTPKADTAGGAK